MLGKKVFEYRGKHNITQEKFAQLCGVSRPTINRVEKDNIKLHARSQGKIMAVVDPISDECENIKDETDKLLIKRK